MHICAAVILELSQKMIFMGRFYNSKIKYKLRNNMDERRGFEIYSINERSYEN